VDLNRLAARIVKDSTEPETREAPKDPAATKRGQKGGKTRAQRMTPEQRSEAAKRAAQARWSRP
jgi:hypothetical protein